MPFTLQKTALFDKKVSKKDKKRLEGIFEKNYRNYDQLESDLYNVRHLDKSKCLAGDVAWIIRSTNPTNKILALSLPLLYDNSFIFHKFHKIATINYDRCPA